MEPGGHSIDVTAGPQLACAAVGQVRWSRSVAGSCQVTGRQQPSDLMAYNHRLICTSESRLRRTMGKSADGVVMHIVGRDGRAMIGQKGTRVNEN